MKFEVTEIKRDDGKTMTVTRIEEGHGYLVHTELEGQCNLVYVPPVYAIIYDGDEG